MSHAAGPAVTRPQAASGHGPPPAGAGQRSGPASLTASLVLPATVTAPGRARAALRDALAQWGLRHLTDLAEAIASELVTNAVAASGETAPGNAAPAPLTLRITVQHGELRIRVWDPDPVPPPRDHQPGTWDENGRGLMIVKALSRRWDWDPAEDGGKYVWAALSLTELPALRFQAPRGTRAPGSVPAGVA